MRFRILAFCILALFAACGDSIPQRVPKSDRLTIYSLKAYQEPSDRTSNDKLFCGYTFLGKFEVADAAERVRVIDALNRAMAQPVTQAKCFWPRHGVRVESGGKTTDYIICFECANFEVQPGEPFLTESIGKTAQPVLDELLKKAGIPLNSKASD